MKFNITAPDDALRPDLQAKIDGKTKPLGALGRLEGLALQLGLIQQTLTPELRAPHILVCAGDHGAAKAGISAYPQEVTWQMVENFLAGGAAINVLARANGLALVVADAGVNHEFGPRENLIDAKVSPRGTANYLEGPAMTAEQCETALARGAQIVAEIHRRGCNVVGFGEMGIGNTASASLITHFLAGIPLADCVGRGTGLDDAGVARKLALLQQAAGLYRGDHTPPAVLAHFGGFEIAMLAGGMLAAAERKMLLLIDGFIVTSALLVAATLHPATLQYCVFSHRSQERGHRLQLEHLGARPLLDMDLRLGEGTGAALAWPLLRAACAFLNEMASFESAGVSVRNDLSPAPFPEERGDDGSAAAAGLLTSGHLGAAGGLNMLRQEAEAFFGAVRFFTRLPVPARVGHSQAALDRAARYFPLVGVLVGVLGGLTFLLAAFVLPVSLALLFSMAATLLVTGAFHEDGLADAVDGFGGGWTREQVLAIMKDSRIGSYGALAVALMLLAKFNALYELPDEWIAPALVAAHAASRFCSTALIYALDYVRDDDSARARPLAVRMGAGSLAVAALFGLAPLALLPWEAALAGLGLAALTTFLAARHFVRRIGGYTGDCLGATQQGAELALYLGILAVAWNFS